MRFLLDENVRVELDTFLKKKGMFVKRLPKGATDKELAIASREEKLVVVTNDEDFLSFPIGQVFATVLLRIPQHDASALFVAFENLLSECTTWESHSIVLHIKEWHFSSSSSKHRTPVRRRR